RLAIRIFLPAAGSAAIVKRFTVSVRDLKLETITKTARQSQVHGVVVRAESLKNCAYHVKRGIPAGGSGWEELSAVGQDRRNCCIPVSLAKEVAAARTYVGDQENGVLEDLSLQVEIVLHDVRGFQIELHRFRNRIDTFEQRRIHGERVVAAGHDQTW